MVLTETNKHKFPNFHRNLNFFKIIFIHMFLYMSNLKGILILKHNHYYFFNFFKKNEILHKLYIFSLHNSHDTGIKFDKNEYLFFSHVFNLKAPSFIVKKLIFKKFKKRYAKFEHFPWKVKNYLTKKLLRIKQKNIFFENKNILLNNWNGVLLNCIFSYKDFFLKNNVTPQTNHLGDLFVKKIKNVDEVINWFVYDSCILKKTYNISFNENAKVSFYTSNILLNTCKPIRVTNLSKIYYNQNPLILYFKKNSHFTCLFTQTCYGYKSSKFKFSTQSWGALKYNWLLNTKKRHTPLEQCFKYFIFGSSRINLLNIVLLRGLSFFKLNNNYNVFTNLITNYTPLNILGNGFKKLISYKFIENNQPNFYKYVYFYLISFLESITQKKLFLKLKTKIQLSDYNHKHLSELFNKHRSYQSKVGRGFFFFEMLEILFISFLQKDVNLLMDWFVKTMERIQFRSHKKFISTFRFMLVNYKDFFVLSNNIKGFFFDIRGKVGVAGNAKKRHTSFNVGKFSKTTKYSKLEYQQQIVRTFTGALGVTMIMYF